VTAILQSSVHTLWHRCSGHRGRGLVWLHYLPHWKETPTLRRNWLLLYRAGDSKYSYKFTERNHCHLRARLRSWRDFFQDRFSGWAATGLGPYLMGSLVWGIGLSLGGPTGYAINPARDLGRASRMPFFRLQGRWLGLGLCPIPVIGPLIGGVLAGVLLRVLAVSDL